MVDRLQPTMLIPRVTELTRAGRPFVALASLPAPAPRALRPSRTRTAAARGAAPLRSRQLSRA
jgi:hypothetical protein